MLITSLLMTINQLLPVVILAVLLSLIVPLSQRQVSIYAVIGILMSLVFVQTAAWLSQLFDHRGLEFIQMLLCIIIFVAALISCQQRSIAAALALIATMALYLSHYMIYLVSFWHSKDTAEPLILGTFLGVGICISFGVLLFFLLESITKRAGVQPLIVLLAFNATAKLLVLLDLASQVDLLDVTANYLDWRGFLVENSELGRVLKALVGYEATPSKTALWVYVVATLAFIIIVRVLKIKKTKEPVCGS
ncbi:iron transporter [Pseudoalteromonas sp. N1230-9]|uniref:iron transporter n=1 Tax=Pseudoalteromonas sp. N1230-9 TaxID=2907156 RepID=UPI002B305736|nr:iron transporter [Pseudoalteromonas sp. N1230-9]